MAKPIALYYWPTPNGHKISLALEEMKLDYDLHPVNIGKGEQFTPEFLAISPNNRMPAIVDPKGPRGKPISVFESGAILQYLGRKTGKFYPKDERARVSVDEWLMWQMAGLGPMAGQYSHFVNYAARLVDDDSKIAYARERYAKETLRLLGVLDRRLAVRDYVADTYSIADMASFPWVRAAARMGLDMSALNHVRAWLDRIEARPAVARALKVGADLSRRFSDLSKEDADEAARNLFGQTTRTATPA